MDKMTDMCAQQVERGIRVGELVKVSLPGESPWAEVIEIYPDGTWLGRIDNHLWGGNAVVDHDYKFGDLILFAPPYLANRGIMVSVPANRH
jgi:hypothetical protein